MKQSDTGYYICYGKNSQGSNRDYVYVDVREARENENNNAQKEEEAEESSSNNEGLITHIFYYKFLFLCKSGFGKFKKIEKLNLLNFTNHAFQVTLYFQNEKNIVFNNLMYLILYLANVNEENSQEDQSAPQVKIISEQNPISIFSGIFLKTCSINDNLSCLFYQGDSLTLECDIKGMTETPKVGSTWERHGGDLAKHTEKKSSVQ